MLTKPYTKLSSLSIQPYRQRSYKRCGGGTPLSHNDPQHQFPILIKTNTRSLSSKRYIYFTLRPDMTLPLLHVTDSPNKTREKLGNKKSSAISLIAVNILQRKTCTFLLVPFILKLLLQQQQQ